MLFDNWSPPADKSVIRIVLTGFICLIISGCTTQYTANVTSDALTDVRMLSTYQVNRSADWVLNPRTHLYLARGVFSNPAREADLYPRLSNAVFTALAHSLSQAFPSIGVAVETQPLSAALIEARMTGASILVYPGVVFLCDELDSVREIYEGTTVHHDKSLAPDRLAFKVVLVDVSTGNIVDVAIVKGRSRLFTLENDGPVALLPDAALAYTQHIVGTKIRM